MPSGLSSRMMPSAAKLGADPVGIGKAALACGPAPARRSAVSIPVGLGIRGCRAASRAATASSSPISCPPARARLQPAALGIVRGAVDRAGKLVQMRQRERRVEIVFERVAHRRQRSALADLRNGRPAGRARGRSGRGSAAPGAASARSSRAGRGNASSGARGGSPRPAPSSSNSRTVRMLPSDFDILAPSIGQHPVVHPIPRRTGGRAWAHVALRDLVLVVRENEVETAAVDVEGLAEMRLAHRRAFDVPARPAAAPRAVPTRLVRVDGFHSTKSAGSRL